MDINRINVVVNKMQFGIKIQINASAEKIIAIKLILSAVRTIK